MAQINPYDINLDTECYAAVRYDIGFITGRIKGWKLYNLNNPTLCRTLSQSPGDVLAAFETREELEQWLADLYKEPAQDTPEVKLNTIGKEGGDKLIISSIL
ncbi:hypothetical protein [Pontibacter ruber]|uniref:Uncharacterized protein n=1 Tax=Pontibacter ruber TaxID=1343895 RepID=A0ABW5CTW4_9BACT|nr:hypothetical protein [Pontibacter ruber]